MARIIANIALITEAQPFTPHTQGTRFGEFSLRYAKAKGKGIPIKNANGAIAAMVIQILIVVVDAKNKVNISSRIRL